MNKNVIIGIVVIIIVVLGYLSISKNYQQTSTPTPTKSSNKTQDTSSGVAKNAVTIKNFAYARASITVHVGDSVTWTNQDSAGHSATADDGSFDTGVLSTGKSNTVSFAKAGTFAYHCSVHPNMKGTVVVE